MEEMYVTNTQNIFPNNQYLAKITPYKNEHRWWCSIKKLRSLCSALFSTNPDAVKNYQKLLQTTHMTESIQNTLTRMAALASMYNYMYKYTHI